MIPVAIRNPLPIAFRRIKHFMVAHVTHSADNRQRPASIYMLTITHISLYVNPSPFPIIYNIPQQAPKKHSSRLLSVTILPIIAITSSIAMNIPSVIIMNFIIAKKHRFILHIVFGLWRKNQFTWTFSSCSLSLAISLPTR